jgi:hypothetical protein
MTAEDWFPMRILLWEDHPVFLRIAEICQMADVDLAIGKFGRLLARGHRHSTDGLFRRSTLRTIDNMVGYPGFAKALVEVGWGKLTPEGFQVEKWDEFNGNTAKKRFIEGIRKQKYRRAKQDNQVNATVNLDEKCGTTAGQVRDNSGTTHGTDTGQVRDKIRDTSGTARDNDGTEAGQERDRNGTKEQEQEQEQDSKKLKDKKGTAFHADGVKEKCRFDPLTIPLPFASEAFKTAWRLWVEHRRKTRKPLAEPGTQQTLKRFAELGEELSIYAIERAVTNGWQGLGLDSLDKDRARGSNGGRMLSKPGEYTHLDQHNVPAAILKPTDGTPPDPEIPF